MLRRRAASAIGVLFSGVLLSLVVAWSIFGETSEAANEITCYILFGATSFLALALLGKGAFKQSTPLTFHAAQLPFAILAGVLGFGVSWAYVSVLTLALSPEGGPEVEAMTPTFVLSAVILAPLVEEWMDRGILWNATRRITGVPMTILVTSALFALSHGLAGFFLALPHRFVGGLILGTLRARSGSLLPGMLAHAIWNLLAVTV